ncbi:MAG: chemotaxis protein CheW [Acidobacteriia bacterium]|nr:chemotaxis protein CheW [Terriglobia bacterium]
MSDEPVVELHALALAELRSAFDESFALPSRSREHQESVIQVRVGSEVFAIRTGHIAGLVKSKKIVPLPSRIPELRGLAALRGSLIPVYDLAALLGIPPGVSGPSWLVLVSCDTLIGLAFDGFEGQQVPEWLSDQQSERQYVRQLVRIGSAVRAVLDIPGLAAAIRKRAGLAPPAKERKS